MDKLFIRLSPRVKVETQKKILRELLAVSKFGELLQVPCSTVTVVVAVTNSF